MGLMGKITGFLEIEREDRSYEPAADRIRHYREFVIPPSEAEIGRQAARCMDCGIPYCHTGCPVNNQIPDWNDLVYHADWQRGGAEPALDQQFPRSDGPHLPGAVRGRLHAQHHRRPRHHQIDRMRHRRQGLRRRLGHAAAAGDEDRQARGDRRLRSRRARRGAAARPRRPRRACLREERLSRRPAPLRHPRFQDGEIYRRAPRQADGGRGRHLPLQRPCRARSPRQEARARL